MDKITQSAREGIQRGFEQVAQASQTIAQGFGQGGDGDIVSAVVDLNSGEMQVKSAALVLAVADKLKGTILDILG